MNYDKYLYSTGTHYISNSGSDENKAYHGGKAGDQTGHEWELKAWYDRPWSCVLRYPDQAVALKLAELSIAAALNDNIGYDQDGRTSYWKALERAGYDPSKITEDCEEDCTAGVSANVRAVGHLLGIRKLQDVPICSSRNMKQEFTRAGFEALTASKYLDSPKYLLPGDVLLYENHHAACNITIGSAVRDAWHPEKEEEEKAPEADWPAVCITGKSVYVRKGPDTAFGSLGVVHSGDRLRYFGFDYPSNGWHLVEYREQTGWVSGKYGCVER